MPMRKILGTMVILVLLAFATLPLVNCGGTGSSGDYMESGYNFAGGIVAISNTGTATVAHGLTSTPTAVSVIDWNRDGAAHTSGTVTFYISDIGTTTFKVKAVDTVDASTVASGSIMWMATTE